MVDVVELRTPGQILRKNAKKFAKDVYLVVSPEVAQEVKSLIRALLDELDRVEAELAEAEFILNEGGTWEAQLQAAEARASSAESSLSLSEFKLGEAVKALEPFAEYIKASDQAAAYGQRQLQPNECAALSDDELARMVDPDTTLKLTDGRMAFGKLGIPPHERKHVSTGDFRLARSTLALLKPGEKQ